MSLPCVPTVPLPGGLSPPDASERPLPLPDRLYPVPRAAAYELPRYLTDFPLGRLPVAYFFATLARASYQASGALFTEAVRCVLPGTYPVTYVANQTDTPGYGVVRLPRCAIVVISGTTNLGQWLRQLFVNLLVDWGTVGNLYVKYGTMSIYATVATAINAALAPLITNDLPILYVGHSMGGAIAQLLHALSAVEGSPRVPSRCCSFAAPKPGDARLIDGLRTGSQVFRRWQLDGDFVPSLPPDLGFLRLAAPPQLGQYADSWALYGLGGSPYYITAGGQVRNDVDPFLPLLVAGALAAAAVGLPLAPVQVHLMRSYTERFRAAAASSLPGMVAQGWTSPTRLDVVNDQLTQLGL